MSDPTPYDEPAEPARIGVRCYAAGKAFIFTAGNPDFAERVEAALVRSLETEVRLDGERFARLLRAQGVPDEVIAEYAARVTVQNEVWMQGRMPA